MNRDDYLAQMHALLPPGVALLRDLGPGGDDVLAQMLALPAGELARIEARAAELLAEADPRTTLELLPEWEADYGLPDPCVGPGQTLQERRAALLAQIIGAGGQSRAYFIAVAAALGFAVTIEEFRPFRAGSLSGTPLYGVAWLFAWRVRSAEAETIREFRVGISAAGEPLRRWGNQALECSLSRLKPAQTQILFAYGS